MAGVTVAESLRAMVALAKDASVEELHAEKARLETRLDAINRLLEWREKINLLTAASESGPAVPPPSDPRVIPPAVRIPPSAHDDNGRVFVGNAGNRQDSVDSQDPPPRKRPSIADNHEQDDREARQALLNAGGDPDLSIDDEAAKKRTLEYLELPETTRSAQFATRLSAMVLACGNEERSLGHATTKTLTVATGLTGEYTNRLLADPRIQHKIERVGFGKYKLTTAGIALYRALTAPSSGAGAA